MRFRPGQKVKVRAVLDGPWAKYDSCLILAGEVVTINEDYTRELRNSGIEDERGYVIEEDNKEHWWPDRFFIGDVEEDLENIFCEI